MMSRGCLLTLGAVLLAAPAATGTQALYIEQEIVHQAVAGRPEMVGLQKTWMAEGKIRNEVRFGEEPRSILLVDMARKRVVLIPSDEKQYVQLSLDAYREMVSMRLRGYGLDPSGPQPVLQATGETRRIGEWNCSGYLFRQEGKLDLKLRMWIAADTRADFAAYLRMTKQLGLEDALGQLAGFAEQLPGFPIEVQMEMIHHGQKVSSRHRVRAIQARKAEPGLFEIPPDYERIENDTLIE